MIPRPAGARAGASQAPTSRSSRGRALPEGRIRAFATDILEHAEPATRFDPATGTALATITVPAGSGCGFLGGSFVGDGDAWAGCSVLARPVGPNGATVVDIDPDGNTVTHVVTVPGFSGGLVVDGALWLIVPRDLGDGTITSSLVVIDPVTKVTTAVSDLGPLDADTPVLTSTALWIPDEQGHRLLKFDRADLRPWRPRSDRAPGGSRDVPRRG